MGYSLPDFQPNRSNFFAAHPPAAALKIEGSGVDTRGGEIPYCNHKSVHTPKSVVEQSSTIYKLNGAIVISFDEILT